MRGIEKEFKLNEAVIVAIISGAVALVGSILTFLISLKQIQAKQSQAQEEQLNNFKSDITSKLEEHRKEYISGIADVKENITDMRAVYQQTIAIVELKIDALEKKQDVHNNLIARMYEVEKKTEVQDEMIKVANHRIEDLEKKS